jgi:acyl transferase domain-containing protein
MQPSDIGYLEVNGGGSLVVDAVEIKALAQIYDLKNTDLGACHAGSVKPNLGHLLLSSGIAGFIRCVLSVHHGRIPPFLSALEPFEHFDFGASRIRFNRTAVPWDVHSRSTRVAAQNSFADGGTNCHVIVEQFIPPQHYSVLRPPVPTVELQRRCYPMRPKADRSQRLQEGTHRVTTQEREGFGTDEQIEVRSKSVINFWGEFREESV